MVTFTINRHRERASAPILMLVSHRGTQYRKYIGISVPVRYWSAAKHCARTTADFDGSDINVQLSRWRTAAENTLAKFRGAEQAPAEAEFLGWLAAEYGDILRRTVSTETTMADYLEKVYIPRYSRVRTEETVKKYRTALNKLRGFEAGTSSVIRWKDVDMDFYSRFEKWFYGQGYSANYFGSVIKIIKQCYAEARDVDRQHDGSGTSQRGFRTVSEQGAAVYLTTEELKMIESCDLSPERLMKEFGDQRPENRQRNALALDRARKLFLIGCYTGLRVSDFSRLERTNFSGDRLRLRTRKTGSDIVIPVHPVVRRILDGGFSFSDRISDQKMNVHIKEVCRLAGIDGPVTIYRSSAGKSVAETRAKYQLISNHTARRSFATNAAKAGVPMVVIMKILGMSRETTLVRYLRQSAEENADILAETSFFREQ